MHPAFTSLETGTSWSSGINDGWGRLDLLTLSFPQESLHLPSTNAGHTNHSQRGQWVQAQQKRASFLMKIKWSA
jgi:hypothetical protein